MKVAIVYASITGNTEELAEEIYRTFLSHPVTISIHRIEDFTASHLHQYDAIVIGTYTWGNGTIPEEMWGLYYEIEALKRKDLITAVFGTGDSCYPRFCGAVDLFRNMLYVQTNLAATLKVELTPQSQDLYRCQRFVEAVMMRMNLKFHQFENSI